ncbi:major facilitator superfamily domain-containing protein [Aspergillus cavernicola]|uniref:Major facilitator superfamily domain-containing protein n=1 Tax=Aspergillus cavernicola TaxID=176166 RepID=A0ABR4IGV8_9EURO
MEDHKPDQDIEVLRGEKEKGVPEVKTTAVLNHQDEKALMRKVDRHILPLMFTAYMLQYLDKTALGYTAIFGIQESLDLVGDHYSWSSSAFYFGFLVASYPVSVCFVKFPIGKFLSISFIIWAVIVTCHGATSNFAGLTTVRVLLGVFESTISPGLSLVTSLWYKRSEHASRHGIWFAGNSISTIFGGLLTYGIVHINSSIESWRWIFIIFGVITFLYGILFIICLPDTPHNARFLTKEEGEFIHQRAQQETHTAVSYKWSKSQCIEALIDPKTWLIFVYAVGSCIPNGGLTSFGSIVIAGFGYSTLNTLLVSLPMSVFTFFWVALATIITSKVRKSRCITTAVLVLISLAGCLMVAEIDPSKKVARLAGMWFFPAYSAGVPIIMSIIASNVAGYTKRTTVSAVMFIGNCTGNIIGPFLFFSNEMPDYESAWIGIMISLAGAFISILVLRQLFHFQNQRRDSQQKVKLDPESREAIETEVVAQDKDETDWENQNFRYYL